MTLSAPSIRTEAPPPPLSRVAVVYVTNEAQAHVLIDEMVADADGRPVALDLETTPIPEAAAWLRNLRAATARCKGTLAGLLKARATAARIAGQKGQLRRLKAAVKYAETAGLDPHRADIRLLQLYGGGRRVTVIDLFRTGLAILQRSMISPSSPTMCSLIMASWPCTASSRPRCTARCRPAG